jgi:hypothetical protein
MVLNIWQVTSVKPNSVASVMQYETSYVYTNTIFIFFLNFIVFTREIFLIIYLYSN